MKGILKGALLLCSLETSKTVPHLLSKVLIWHPNKKSAKTQNALQRCKRMQLSMSKPNYNRVIQQVMYK